MKPKEFEDYVPVTAANRKNAVIKGRILYCIEVISDKIINYCGYFPVRPQLTVGRLKMKGHPYLPDGDTYINEDENFEDYKNSFNELITILINKKKLYFKLTDPLIKYEKI